MASEAMNVTASSVAAAPLSVAFIGVGEAGQTFARGLHAEGVRDIRLYDILFDAPQSSLRATASAMANELPGVRLCASHAEAVRGASLVFLAVTAASSLDAARACISALGAGALLLDINSVSPQRKRETAALVEAGASGARYVDVAVMAAVAKPRHKVPLLIGGPGGEAFAALLPRLGMQGEFVSAEVGEASAVKMCRSIMIKGIEALTVECMLTATHFGVQQRVLASLTETFPSLEGNGCRFPRLSPGVLVFSSTGRTACESAVCCRSPESVTAGFGTDSTVRSAGRRCRAVSSSETELASLRDSDRNASGGELSRSSRGLDVRQRKSVSSARKPVTWIESVENTSHAFRAIRLNQPIRASISKEQRTNTMFVSSLMYVEKPRVPHRDSERCSRVIPGLDFRTKWLRHQVLASPGLLVTMSASDP